MEAILFALLAYVGWGTGDVFGTIASRKLGVIAMLFWDSVLSLLFLALLAPFMLKDLQHLTPETLFISFLLSLFFVAGSFTFVQALIVGNASVMGTIMGSFGAVAVILSIVIFHEQVTSQQIFSMVLIFIGVLLATFQFHDIRQGNLLFSRGTIYALVTMLLFGVWATFVRIPVERIGWFWPSVSIWILLLPISFIAAKIQKAKIEFPTKNKVFFPLVISVILLRIAELSYNVAVSKGLTAIVAPIATSYPTLFALLAFFVFKDRITKQQVGGIIVTLCGIVLLGIFSS